MAMPLLNARVIGLVVVRSFLGDYGGGGGAIVPAPCGANLEATDEEPPMTCKILRAHSLLLTISITVVSLTAWADEVTISGKNIREAQIAKTTYSGPTAKTKVEVTVNRVSTTSDHPDWHDSQSTHHTLTIKAEGLTRQSGYGIRTHANGDISFYAYEGSIDTRVNADKSWESNWSGTWTSLGGTGKFANMKSSGTYRGRATSATGPEGTAWEGTANF